MRETSHNIPGGILRAWAGPNIHKNSSKATTTASSKATTTAASPVYEVTSCHQSSFIGIGRPLGDSFLSQFDHSTLPVFPRSAFLESRCAICVWPLGVSLWSSAAAAASTTLLAAFFLPARPEASGRVTAGYPLPDQTHHHFLSDNFQPPWPEVQPEVWPFSFFMEEMCSP